MKMPMAHTAAYKLCQHIYDNGMLTRGQIDCFLMFELGMLKTSAGKLFTETKLDELIKRKGNRYDIAEFVVAHFEKKCSTYVGVITPAPYRKSVFEGGPIQAKYLPKPPYRPEGEESKSWPSRQL